MQLLKQVHAMGWASLVQWTRLASTLSHLVSFELINQSSKTTTLKNNLDHTLYLQILLKGTNENMFKPCLSDSDCCSALCLGVGVVFHHAVTPKCPPLFWKQECSSLINREIICHYGKSLLCLKLLSPADVAKRLLSA